MDTFVVVCTDLSDEEPYREVGVDSMVTSGSLGGVMVSTLARNAIDVALIPLSRHNISYLIHTPMTLVCGDHDPVQAMHCMAVKPTLCMCI